MVHYRMLFKVQPDCWFCSHTHQINLFIHGSCPFHAFLKIPGWSAVREPRRLVFPRISACHLRMRIFCFFIINFNMAVFSNIFPSSFRHCRCTSTSGVEFGLNNDLYYILDDVAIKEVVCKNVLLWLSGCVPHYRLADLHGRPKSRPIN